MMKSISMILSKVMMKPLLLVLVLMLFACTQQGRLVDIISDADDRRCIISAGESWCEAEQKCLPQAACIPPEDGDGEISNFEECVAVGSPVMESYPRRCSVSGKTFTEKTFAEEEEIDVQREGREYAELTLEACKLVLFRCAEGKTPFSDDTGCGCEPLMEERSYVKTSPEECETIRFKCEGSMEAFFDETGCGCQVKQETACVDPRPEICTREYHQICGWWKDTIPCIKYPCANEYDNPCTACSDENVAYWTEGVCPE